MNIRALLLIGVGVATASHAQSVEVAGERAPMVRENWVERGSPSLLMSDPAWNAAAIRGSSRSGPIVLPPTMPGEPMQIGLNSAPPGGAITPETGGTLGVEGKSLVWRARIDTTGAAALRLRLSDLQLPAGGAVTILGERATLGYTVRGRGSMGNGTEWTPVLDGGRAYVEYRGPLSAGTPRLAIDEVSEIAAPWPRVDAPSRLLGCEVDVQCESVDPIARDSVGWMVYSTPSGTFVCTGSLLNDTDPSTTKGWFLTSNRCINTQAAAASLTVYWFFQTPACNGQPPLPVTLPVSQGATLLTTEPVSRSAFLQLSQDPSAGQGLAGWTSAEPIGGLSSIHHPEGGFKRIARGLATVVPPICTGTLGYYQYHYVDYTLGITEDGSTGAPLFNTSWQVVGQLYGVCANATPACDNPAQWNAVYGRMSRSLPYFCSYLTGGSSPARVYVNAAATGAGTGTSWTDAFTDLGAALASICPPPGGTEVWVAGGVYKPAAPGGPRESAFQLAPGVRLYGGFAGTETSLPQRNIGGNPTVLSGDLNGNDGPAFAGRSDNVYHVVRGTGTDQTSVLDGFTIRGGNANGPSSFNDKGGGLYIESGSPRVALCRFEDNSASFFGGAIAYSLAGIVDISDCDFIGNQAGAGGGAIWTLVSTGTVRRSNFEGNTSQGNGGAVDLYDSSPAFVNCSFKGNTTASRGGAANAAPSGSPSFTDCRFELNAAGYGGGGASVSGTTATFAKCTFLKNTAAFFGGAILHVNQASTTVSACRILGNSCSLEGGAVNANTGTADFVNCEFSGNRSTGHSGGAIFSTHDCVTLVRSCTLSRNVAALEAGGVAADEGPVTLVNSVLWGNTDANGAGEDAQIKKRIGTVTVSYSVIQGLTGLLGGTGNVGGDPRFASALGLDGIVGTEDDDLLPVAGSSAVDAGDTQAVLLLTVDVRGSARRADDPCQTDTGTGPEPVVDMGAIERTGCACYANCDNSVTAPVLNANDFVCFLTRFAQGSAYANCDGSTIEPILNANDFVCFLSSFAAGCP